MIIVEVSTSFIQKVPTELFHLREVVAGNEVCFKL